MAIDGVTDAALLYGIWIYNLSDGTQKPVVTGTEGMMRADTVALEPRSAPNYLAGSQESQPDPDLVAQGLAVLHIRSAYDVDASDTSAGIQILADPLQSAASDRPARFIRIVKAVSQPDNDLVDIPETAFGRSSRQLMRDIIGYAMVEPDGSAKLSVPANIAFALSVLDAEGKRISKRYNNWLQLMPGEEKHCNGCHTASNELTQGRIGAEFDTMNSGAVTTGSAFPNAEPALFADAGETMAETLARVSGLASLSVDISFEDLWTNPAQRPKDLAFAYLYGDLETPAPTTSACQTQWQTQWQT